MKFGKSNLLKVEKTLSGVGDALAGALYPSGQTCAKCGRDVFGEEIFCSECAASLTRNDGRFCPKCGMKTESEGPCIRCAGNVNYFERAWSVYVYDDGIKPVLRKFKEQGARYLAGPLAESLYEYMREFRIEADVLTFVPLTKRKRAKRGYNQSEELAKELSKRSGIPCEEMLEKTVDTEEQKNLNFTERQENLKGKFRLKNSRTAELRRVLLLDDVMTTTATANECCRILSRVCENGVKVLTICSTLKKIRTE